MSCYIDNTRRTHFLYSSTYIPSRFNPGSVIHRHPSHVGAIVSGVVAGVVAISSTIVLLLCLRRRRRTIIRQKLQSEAHENIRAVDSDLVAPYMVSALDTDISRLGFTPKSRHPVVDSRGLQGANDGPLGLHWAHASDSSPHATADEQEPRPNPLRESLPLPSLPGAHYLHGYAGISTPQLVQILHARLQTGDNAEQLAQIENPPRYED